MTPADAVTCNRAAHRRSSPAWISCTRSGMRVTEPESSSAGDAASNRNGFSVVKDFGVETSFLSVRKLLPII
jgi:hypothetical protein